jgi:hypothetical protein
LLRLALFFHELRRRIGARCEVEIGRTIPFEQLAHLRDRKALVETLRQATYGLAVPQTLAQHLLRDGSDT